VTKVDAASFNAFSSPNLPPLANAEVDITSKQHHLLSVVIYATCNRTLAEKNLCLCHWNAVFKLKYLWKPCSL